MPPVTRLLLDEMLSDDIAQQLRDKGHDVLAVVANHSLVALPDSAVLAHATSENRMVVTKNIKDFMVLDAHYRATGSPHAGLVLGSRKTIPEAVATVLLRRVIGGEVPDASDFTSSARRAAPCRPVP